MTRKRQPRKAKADPTGNGTKAPAVDNPDPNTAKPDVDVDGNSTAEETTSSEHEEKVYSVESILDVRYSRNRLEYLIHWEGYDSKADTWEPENIFSTGGEKLKEMFEEFKDDEANKKKIDDLRKTHASKKSRGREKKQLWTYVDVEEEREKAKDELAPRELSDADEYFGQLGKEVTGEAKKLFDPTHKTSTTELLLAQLNPADRMTRNKMRAIRSQQSSRSNSVTRDESASPAPPAKKTPPTIPKQTAKTRRGRGRGRGKAANVGTRGEDGTSRKRTNDSIQDSHASGDEAEKAAVVEVVTGPVEEEMKPAEGQTEKESTDSGVEIEMAAAGTSPVKVEPLASNVVQPTSSTNRDAPSSNQVPTSSKKKDVAPKMKLGLKPPPLPVPKAKATGGRENTDAVPPSSSKNKDVSSKMKPALKPPPLPVPKNPKATIRTENAEVDFVFKKMDVPPTTEPVQTPPPQPVATVQPERTDTPAAREGRRRGGLAARFPGATIHEGPVNIAALQEQFANNYERELKKNMPKHVSFDDFVNMVLAADVDRLEATVSLRGADDAELRGYMLRYVDANGQNLYHKLCQLKCDGSHNVERTLHIIHKWAYPGIMARKDTRVGCTPLHFAVKSGQACLVLRLTRLLSPLNYADVASHTPLVVAYRMGDMAVFNTLLLAGANYSQLESVEDRKREQDRVRALYETLKRHSRTVSRLAAEARLYLYRNMREVKAVSPVLLAPLCEGPQFTFNYHHFPSRELVSNDFTYLLFMYVVSVQEADDVKKWGMRCWEGIKQKRAPWLNGVAMQHAQFISWPMVYLAPLTVGDNKLHIHLGSMPHSAGCLLAAQFVLVRRIPNRPPVAGEWAGQSGLEVAPLVGPM